MPEKALVIVPTYNERENIERLIDRALAQDDRLEILVVDDGSPDGTGAVVDSVVAANRRVHVLHRAGKMGLGTAYLAGFRWALERDYAFVLEMDADFSHDPIHLPQFLAAAANADLVVGSRYQQGRVTDIGDLQTPSWVRSAAGASAPDPSTGRSPRVRAFRASSRSRHSDRRRG